MSKVYVSVRHYPDRRKPCLAVEVGNEGMVLATFRNEKMVDAWQKIVGNNVAIVCDIDGIDSIDDLIKELDE